MQQPHEINLIVLGVLAICAFIATIIKLLVMPAARGVKNMLAAFIVAPIAMLMCLMHPPPA